MALSPEDLKRIDTLIALALARAAGARAAGGAPHVVELPDADAAVPAPSADVFAHVATLTADRTFTMPIPTTPGRISIIGTDWVTAHTANIAFQTGAELWFSGALTTSFQIGPANSTVFFGRVDFETDGHKWWVMAGLIGG